MGSKRRARVERRGKVISHDRMRLETLARQVRDPQHLDEILKKSDLDPIMAEEVRKLVLPMIPCGTQH